MKAEQIVLKTLERYHLMHRSAEGMSKTLRNCAASTCSYGLSEPLPEVVDTAIAEADAAGAEDKVNALLAEILRKRLAKVCVDLGGELEGIKMLGVDKTAIKRGTIGYIKFNDERRSSAIVLHTFHRQKMAGKVFEKGALLVHYAGHKRAYAIVNASSFEPSRSAYWSEGSWVEPKWDGDTCRCTNYWAKSKLDSHDPNSAENVMTDEQALQLCGADEPGID